jgi:hypothetical protein
MRQGGGVDTCRRTGAVATQTTSHESFVFETGRMSVDKARNEAPGVERERLTEGRVDPGRLVRRRLVLGRL